MKDSSLAFWAKVIPGKSRGRVYKALKKSLPQILIINTAQISADPLQLMGKFLKSKVRTSANQKEKKI